MVRFGKSASAAIFIFAVFTSTVCGQPPQVKAETARKMKDREGNLKPGDQAPNFKLKSLDGKREVDLASLLRHQKPIVLIFGSYT